MRTQRKAGYGSPAASEWMGQSRLLRSFPAGYQTGASGISAGSYWPSGVSSGHYAVQAHLRASHTVHSYTHVFSNVRAF